MLSRWKINHKAKAGFCTDTFKSCSLHTTCSQFPLFASFIHKFTNVCLQTCFSLAYVTTAATNYNKKKFGTKKCIYGCTSNMATYSLHETPPSTFILLCALKVSSRMILKPTVCKESLLLLFSFFTFFVLQLSGLGLPTC